MRRALASLRALVLLVIVPHPLWLAVAMIEGAVADVHAQFLSCKTGSCEDLQEAIKAHNEHVHRMNRKFKDVWYYQGTVPEEIRNEATLTGIKTYLKDLQPRKAAVIFHAAEENRLCTWLITYEGNVIYGQPRILLPNDWREMDPARWQELGVRSARKPRVANQKNLPQPLEEAESLKRWNTLLSKLSALLFPDQVVDELLKAKIDTLIVVPISIREGRFERESEADSATRIRSEKTLGELPPANRLVLSIGTVPFLALPIRGEDLVDRMSITIAPGFFIFGRRPDPLRSQFRSPIVAGDPRYPNLDPLDGARDEANKIADLLNSEAVVGESARSRELLTTLRNRAASVDFVLLSTHGSASDMDPVDGSYLSFSDQPLTARELSGLREKLPGRQKNGLSEMDRPLLSQRPLVIMSACETALGKSFAVGTIGLARAWQWAGASNVVMSLWSVDDGATRDLMVDFVRQVLSGKPTDKALQEAAVDARLMKANPAFWAAFSVFGAPEIIPAKQQGGGN